MDAVPMLVGVEGGVVNRAFAISTDGLKLGRDPANEVHIDDSGISRQHARVILHNGAVWVQDAGSRNGVFVNGERVADHKQLGPGDRISIGAHTFEIRLHQPAPATIPPQTAAEAAVSLGVAPPPAKGWKIWPFALALFFVLAFVGCVGLFGFLRPDPPTVAQAPAYSLSSVLPADGAAAAPGPAAPPTLADALATATGVDAAGKQAALPNAPAGSSAAELVERGHALYETGRLHEARTAYQMALKLDAACEICKVRIGRLDSEISAKAQAQLDAGLRYWDSMQTQQAIAAWETVLLLVPDPGDPLHVRAAEGLARARAVP